MGRSLYDESGRRRRHGGFATRSEAAEWRSTKLADVAALRRGDVVATRRREMPTLAELVEEFLAQHNAEANTLRTLSARLRYATEGPDLDGQGGFGRIRVNRLQVHELGAWRKRLPERSACAVHKALRQVLHYAVRARLLDENVACQVPNPEPKRREVAAFESLAHVEAIGAELAPAFRPLPVFAALTGLRPEEWIALERGDVDHGAGAIHVRRVFTDGRVKLYGKQSRSLRVVPLPRRAAQALEELPPRLDTSLLFPTERGFLELHNWRARHWNPAVEAAGLALCHCRHLSGEHERGCRAASKCGCRMFKRSAGSPTPYALRHTHAAFGIAAGVSLYELARFMGTSVEQIDRTYGHLLPDSIERTRTALDAFVAREPSRVGVVPAGV